MNAVGVFGGTFDPVHYGHLRPVDQVQRSLGLTCVRVIPCASPPHRQPPLAGPDHRLAMVELALAAYPALQVDAREIRRGGRSYTVDTLRELRSELGERQSLCLIIGADAFLGLPSWQQWQDIPQLAHVVVMQRPGWKLDTGELPEWAAPRLVDDPLRLDKEPAGWIAVVRVAPVNISATEIRRTVGAGGDPGGMLPKAVWDYIQAHGLYGFHAYA